ncbi:MAG: hypothetical protein JXR73_08055 [Candidatus Omnitrophica bacterium]|nr:hypothetical protein [Candidatus Omnitrophota bacterium]
MQTLADWMASILRVPGEALREFTLQIPLSAAKGIYIFYYVILIIWVLKMRKSEVVGDLPGKKTPINLRPYAVVALIGQIVIYLIF